MRARFAMSMLNRIDGIHKEGEIEMPASSRRGRVVRYSSLGLPLGSVKF